MAHRLEWRGKACLKHCWKLFPRLKRLRGGHESFLSVFRGQHLPAKSVTLLSAAYRETSSYTHYQAEMEVAVISCLLGKLYPLIFHLLQVRFCLIMFISAPIMLWPVELLHRKNEYDLKKEVVSKKVCHGGSWVSLEVQIWPLNPFWTQERKPWAQQPSCTHP